MSKELEIITKYIEKIEEYEKKTGKQYLARYISKKLCIAIKEKLQRLEAIDNSNPDEALEDLDKIEGFMTYHELYDSYKIEIKTIKATLLKAQEQNRVLEIIKNKVVDISIIYYSQNVEDYNNTITFRFKPSTLEQCKLTYEEFDTLKRWVEC